MAILGYAAEPEPDVGKQLQWVETSDQLDDAKKSVDRREFTSLGIYGYTWTIPGVDESRKFGLQQKYGLRIIEGTFDAIQGNEHKRLQGLAAEYAKKYNRYLLDHINTK